jgi:predicted aspartyl protease
MRKLNSIIAFAISLIVSSAAFAQDAQSILDKQLEALGGKEVFITSNSYYAEGKLSVQTLNGTFKIWQKDPAYTRVEADLKVVKIIQGFNGKYKWNIDQNGKLVKQDNPETVAEEIDESRVMRNEYLVDRSSFDIKYGGEEELEGRKYYIIKVKYKSVPERKYFIDKDTYLTRRLEYTKEGESRWSEFDDYRKAGGTMFPYSLKQYDGSNNIIFVTENLKIEDVPLSVFEPEAAKKEEYVFNNGREMAEVPFEMIGNHIFVRASVNKNDKRVFFFDTGAGVNVISLAYARAIGLPLSDPIQGQGIGGNVSIYPVSYNTFELGDITFGAQTVYAIDVEHIQQKLGFELAGIIGMDFINRFVVKIDYDNKTLTFYKPESFKYTGTGAEVKMNGITIEATLNGKHKGKFQLDTGAGSLSLNRPFVESMGWFNRTDDMPMTYSIGADNTKIPSYMALFDSFEIGGYTLTDVPVDFSKADSGVFKGDKMMGNIGNSILRNFTVYFDHNGGRIFLEPGKNMNRFKTNKYGISVTWNMKENYYYIDNITTLSPASRSDIAIGDIVMSINGMEVKSDNVIAIYDMMYNESPDLTLKINRNGEVKEVMVKAEEYVKKFNP